MDKTAIDFYTRLARGLAAQFGSNCEIVIHDLESNDVDPQQPGQDHRDFKHQL